ATGKLPPSVPSGLTITDTNGLIALSWNASQSGDNPLEYYAVWRSLNGADYNVIATTAETQYVDFAVTPGQTYYYYVSAIDTEGLESDHSAPVSAAVTGVIIAAPANLQGISGADAIKLVWDSVSEAEKYRIFQNNVLIGETTENYFIYVTTNHIANTYTIRAVDQHNQESVDSNSVQVASVAPSASITFPSTSPYNTTSPTTVVQGTSQEDFSIEFIELEIVSGSETYYTKASGAKNWQCPLTLENASYTIRARAKSIAETISDWSTSVTLIVNAPATVYKYVAGSWVALQAANVKVHQELNKAATASFTLPTKDLEMKDKVSIRSDGVSFLGRVLTRNHTESGFWDYTCVDESYILQRINVDVLEDDSWTAQGTVNSILRKLFSTLAAEGYVTFGIEPSSAYSYEIDRSVLKGTIWNILEQLSSITSDVFYFDSKLGKLIFKPKTPATSSLQLTYGTNISSWKYEEHRENIINTTAVKGKISDKELPIQDITKNYLLGIYPAERWDYDLYWQTLKKVDSMGSYSPYGRTFKIYTDLYTQEYTTGYIGIRIPLPPVPKSTINFSVPVTKKGNPSDLHVYVYQVPTTASGWPGDPDIRRPTKEFIFGASTFGTSEKVITFSLDISVKPTSGVYFPQWLFIYFA
ncbi:MAG: fibronectin type III domain-containing protein, partial [bacterium]